MPSYDPEPSTLSAKTIRVRATGEVDVPLEVSAVLLNPEKSLGLMEGDSCVFTLMYHVHFTNWTYKVELPIEWEVVDGG